jgi:hypothetical protein
LAFCQAAGWTNCHAFTALQTESVVDYRALLFRTKDNGIFLADDNTGFAQGAGFFGDPVHLNLLYEFADTRSSQFNNRAKANNQIKDLQAGLH